MRKYLVEIKASGGWHTPNGWDGLFLDRQDAESCAARARKHDGWEARVAEIEAPAVADHLYKRLGGEADNSAAY